MTDELRWDAPGPGDWWLVREHVPYPVSQLFGELFPGPTAGWKTGGARYGLSTGTARWAPVNRWMYYGPQVPLTAEELADREVVAATILDGAKPWRDEVARWHGEERPAVVAANRTLQEVDTAALDDVMLSSHLHRTIENFRRWAPLHFEHTAFDLAAGFFLQGCGEWGIAGHDAIGLLAGGSPASAAIDTHLAAIAAALDEAGAPDGPATMEAVIGASPQAAAALGAFLEDYRFRPVAGYDLVEPTLGERPELVLASLAARRARAGSPADPEANGRSAAVADATEGFRRSVPEADRPRFDELLDDARSAYGLRDDDVGVCWNWPIGLIRHAGLEVGRRLVGEGLVEDPGDLFEVSVDELSSLLAGRGPTAAELARRRAVREAAVSADPPLHLAGGPPSEVEPAIPPKVAALAAVRDPVWSVAPPRVDAPLHGVGVGAAAVVGPARLVLETDDIAILRDGDILVAAATTTAFNAVFPLLAGVVTQYGGILSHTAILSRELGLPAVVGVADLFEHIHDGDIVEVDAAAGSVRVLDRPG